MGGEENEREKGGLERRELNMGRWGEGEMERKMRPGFHINLYVP